MKTANFRAVIVLFSLLFLLGLSGTGHAYPRWRDPVTGSGNCTTCHGSFTDSTSPQGTVFPSSNKHEMHRAGTYMATSCGLCHLSTDSRNPYTYQSDGVGTVTGRGCSGCHEPLGLRKHHTINGVTVCATCHNDTGLTIPPESVQPPYYGTAYTRARNTANPLAVARTNENWSIGDFKGLDNDGDNLYDMADPDFASLPKILTVTSLYGGTSPGSLTTNTGTVVSQSITNSPVAGPAGVRYICTGGTVAGNAFSLVNATNMTLTLTNNATLVWQWKTQYMWSATAGANGTVITSNGWYDAGSSASATAVASSGYYFTGWTGSVTSAINPLTVSMTGTRSVTASFGIDVRTLTVISLYGSTSPGNVTLSNGTAVSEFVNGSPVAGPSGTHYICTGGAVAGNGFSPINATNVALTLTNNTTLTWQWKTQYMWSATAGANGSVNTSNGWYDSGAQASATAIANSGYYFTGWTGAVTSTINPLTVPMTGTRSVTATFATTPVIQYTITAASGANGIVSPPGAVMVAQGGNITYTFTPAANYHVAAVLVDSVPIGAPGSYTFTAMATNHTISATFAIDQKTLTVTSLYGTASPGSVTVNYGTSLSESVSTSPVAGPAGVRFVCTGGTVGGNAFSAVSATNLTLSLTNNTTLAWQWKTQYMVTASSGTNGTVTPAGSTWVDLGATSPTYTANPAPGQSIDNWYINGTAVQTGQGTFYVDNIAQPQTVLVTFIHVDQTGTAMILSPTNGAALDTGNIAITAQASDADGLSAVRFYCNGTNLIGTTNLPAGTMSWSGTFDWTDNVQATITLTAEAVDAYGSTSASQTVTVKVTTPKTVVSSLFWQLPTGPVAAWILGTNGGTISTYHAYDGSSAWQVRAARDINGDGIADLIWQLPTGQVAAWLMTADGRVKASLSIFNGTTPWLIRAAGDINGDGVADLIWQLPTGQIAAWLMNADGTRKSSFSVYPIATPWQISTAGDFDGDGTVDLIWQSPTGQVLVWLLNAGGTLKSSYSLYSGTTSWLVRAAGDIDGDGIADLIWQSPTGQVSCWLMNANGKQKSTSSIYSGSTTWQVRCFGQSQF
ncbi:MAG: FG-GAP-like repeat-containing protein [bacterium]